MINTLGQFTFKKEPSIFQLNYTRSIKDWLDITLSFSFGLIMISLMVGLLYLDLEKGVIYTVLLSVLTLLFGYSAYKTFSYVFLRLFTPTKHLVFIDHLKGNINIKLPYNKTKTLKKSDIDLVVYQINTDFVDFSDQIIKPRFWVDVVLIQKDRKPLTFLTINPEDIIECNTHRIQKNLKKIGKGIAKTLANEIGVEYRFKKV